MRLKLSLAREPKHKEIVTAIGWATSDELLSCGDDHQLLKWNLVSAETTSVATLPDTLFPTDIHWFPRGLGGGRKGAGSDLFVLASTDGKFYLISRSGRVEKTVEAHKGAVLSARWSYDGASLLTVGEDGAVKIWSRSGMLRSTLTQNSSPVYATNWSPDNNKVLFCCGRLLTIKPLQANVKATQWKGHDGVILTVDWNPTNNMIISGGEDCKYRVWDNFGRPVYVSYGHEWPITSVAWCPAGSLFAVGTFDTLRLCDKAGWSHCLEKPHTGSIFNLRWSPDGTQVAGGTGNGHVVFGNVIENREVWREFEVVQTKRKTLEIKNVTSDSKEKLELKDRVTKMALGWGYLIVTTATQLNIYSSKNWNTPAISDLKEGSVSLIIMASKLFLMVDGGSVLVLNYDGRVQSNLKWSGMRTEILSEQTVGLSNDTVAVRDKADEKVILLFEATSGKPTSEAKVSHTQGIIELSIDQCGSASERRVAFIDRNNDLFLASVKSFGTGPRIVKLGAMIQSIIFNDSANMLVGLQDTKVVLWPFPSAAYVDRELLPRMIMEKEIMSPMIDFGKGSQLVSFIGKHIVVRRADGTVISTGVSPFPAALHEFVGNGKWDQALRLCRHVRDEKLWATLAAMAAHAKNLNTAEIAYGSINEAEKVQLLEDIRTVNNKDIKAAELALFSGSGQDAERIFLQSGKVFKAIMLNISMYKWERALDLAVKHKTNVDTVLGYRQRFLEDFGRKETNKNFEQHNSEVEIDWETIQERVAAEMEKDK